MPLQITTIRNIADEAGVSISTVSRVLNQAPSPVKISPETRQRVEQTARKLAYRPNAQARSLRNRQTSIVGLIASQVEDAFYARLIALIRSQAKAAGWEVELGYAQADRQEALRLRDRMLDMRYCAGLFLLGDLHESVEDHTFLAEINHDLPTVLLCRGSAQLVGELASVGTDNHRGAWLALEYLASLGHSQIAFVGAGRQGDLSDRSVAYQWFMQNRFGGIPFENVSSSEDSMMNGYRQMAHLLALPQPPTAVFAADDVTAIGAMRAAYEQGVRIPQALSIIGYDDIREAAYLIPALTTIRQPVEEIARQSVDLMQKLIATASPVVDENASHQILVDPALVIRASCAAPMR